MALTGRALDPFFAAVVEATEEAVLNSMLAAPTVTGRDGNTSYGLPVEQVLRAAAGQRPAWRSALSSGEPHAPPVAPRVPSVRELHGETVADDYAWMRDPDEPAFQRIPGRRARAITTPRAGIWTDWPSTLAAEAAGRIPAGPEDSVSWPRGRIHVPHEDAGRTATTGSFCAREADEHAEQVLLDENLVAARDRDSPTSGSASRVRTVPARLVGRPQRGRDLRAAHPGPANGGGPARRSSRRSYPGVAWSVDSRLPLLSRARRAAPAVSGVAPCGGHGGRAPTCSCSRSADQRFELTLEGSRSGELADHHAASRDTTEVRRHRSAAIRWTIRFWSSPGSAAPSTGSITPGEPAMIRAACTWSRIPRPRSSR